MLDNLDLESPTIRRLGVTLVAALVCVAGTWLPVPEATMPGAAYFGLPKWPLSVGALGLLPFMIGFVVAELVGVALHSGGQEGPTCGETGRPGWMRRAGIVGGLLFALLGALAVYHYWFTLVPASLGGGAMPQATHGWGQQLVVLSTLVAGAALYFALADAVTRYGLGNGFAVLVGAGMVVDVYWAYRDFAGWLTSMSFANLDLFAVLGNVFGVAAVILATMWMLFRMDGWVSSGPEASEASTTDGVRYDVPLAGLVPFVIVKAALIAGGTYGFVREMADPGALLRPAMRVWTLPGSWTYLALSMALAIPVTLFFSIAFYRDGWSLSEWLSGDGGARRFRRAVAATIGYVLLLVIVDLFGGELVKSLGVATVALGTAIGCDLIAVWRFRSAHPEAVRVETLHRNRAVGPVLERLQRRGIDAHASGRCFRGLLQVFGAFAPIEVLVPAGEAERAGDIEGVEAAGAEDRR